MAGSLSVYFAVSMQSNTTPIASDDDNGAIDSVSIYDKYEVFPELNQEDFYDKIKIKKAKGVIDEEMQAKFLNYIFDHMEVAEGDVGWSIKVIRSDAIIISVEWISPDKVYSKNYKIDLKNV